MSGREKQSEGSGGSNRERIVWTARESSLPPHLGGPSSSRQSTHRGPPKSGAQLRREKRGMEDDGEDRTHFSQPQSDWLRNHRSHSHTPHFQTHLTALRETSRSLWVAASATATHIMSNYNYQGHEEIPTASEASSVLHTLSEALPPAWGVLEAARTALKAPRPSPDQAAFHSYKNLEAEEVSSTTMILMLQSTLHSLSQLSSPAPWRVWRQTLAPPWMQDIWVVTEPTAGQGARNHLPALPVLEVTPLTSGPWPVPPMPAPSNPAGPLQPYR
jgi:hypothetical protein